MNSPWTRRTVFMQTSLPATAPTCLRSGTPGGSPPRSATRPATCTPGKESGDTRVPVRFWCQSGDEPPRTRLYQEQVGSWPAPGFSWPQVLWGRFRWGLRRIRNRQVAGSSPALGSTSSATLAQSWFAAPSWICAEYGQNRLLALDSGPAGGEVDHRRPLGRLRRGQLGESLPVRGDEGARLSRAPVAFEPVPFEHLVRPVPDEPLDRIPGDAEVEQVPDRRTAEIVRDAREFGLLAGRPPWAAETRPKFAGWYVGTIP